MDGNNETRKLIAWAAPTSLILAPVLLGIVIYRIVRDKMIGVPVNLLDPDLMFIVFFCVAGFLVSLYFCKRELGWFNRKNQTKSVRR